MRPILLRLGLFHSERLAPEDLYGLDRKDSERIVAALLTVLYTADRIYVREHPTAPTLYQSGVRYALENTHKPFEEWLSTPEIYRDGQADCEDLGSARAAELAESGIPAHPQVTSRPLPGNNRLYHVTVRRAAIRRDLPPGWRAPPGTVWRGRPVLIVNKYGPVLWAEKDGTWTEDPSRVLGMSRESPTEGPHDATL